MQSLLDLLDKIKIRINVHQLQAIARIRYYDDDRRRREHVCLHSSGERAPATTRRKQTHPTRPTKGEVGGGWRRRGARTPREGEKMDDKWCSAISPTGSEFVLHFTTPIFTVSGGFYTPWMHGHRHYTEAVFSVGTFTNFTQPEAKIVTCTRIYALQSKIFTHINQRRRMLC